ncbi:MAG: cation:proton antiporter [Gammaproteobacteria bacterium]
MTMGLFEIIAVLISLAALFSYLNERFIRLPATIALMLIALLMSLGLIALDFMGLGVAEHAEAMLAQVDFNKALMHGMLSFLLFAGALHVNLDDLASQKWVISLLATVGVVISTFVVGLLSWWLLGRLGINLPLIYCLLFGALISPTDPIAVLGIIKTANAPKSLATKITGESLFNDGIGVVVFVVIFSIAVEGHGASAAGILELLLMEAGGGILFGLLVGGLAYYLLKQVDNYSVEILISLAVVTGGYALAEALYVSAPITVVVAGLLIGNHGRLLAMSAHSREHLDTFWELMDEVLNAVLFVLMGLEILVLSFSSAYVVAGVLLIPIVLLARLVSVGIPVILLRLRRRFSPHVIKVMTWSGLRGGISVALALSIPPGPERDVILVATYVVVVFSILVQGLTIARLLKATKA